MLLESSNGAPILLPAQIGPLLVEPAFRASVAAQASTRVVLSARSLRVPIVTMDPQASWVAEGQEITPSDPLLAELDIFPSKLAGLTIISAELAADSSPAAAQVVGDGLARDIARKIDAAFFNNLTSPAPAGLGSLTNVSTVSVGANWVSLDPFVDALAAAEVVFASIDSWCASPVDVVQLSKIKTLAGGTLPLLDSDPALPGGRVIFGRPLYTSPAIAPGTIWGIPKAQTLLVVRDDASIDTDGSVFFTSDRVAVRARMRVGFGFPHQAAVVKITRTTS